MTPTEIIYDRRYFQCLSLSLSVSSFQGHDRGKKVVNIPPGTIRINMTNNKQLLAIVGYLLSVPREVERVKPRVRFVLFFLLAHD